MTKNTYDQLGAAHDPLDPPRRVLTIGAHPDDAEFGAGATIARWADEGADVTMCIVTDGSKGSWDPTEGSADLIERRRQEQETAASVLGASRVIHLGHVDGELEYSMELRLEIGRQIRIFRPDVVLSHDPWQRYQMHPDHRATGLSAVDGVVVAREPRALTDFGEPAHRPSALLLWSADEPDHAEPITERWFATKVESLLCHSSQAATTMGNAQRGDEERARFIERLQDWHRDAGDRFGLGPCEAFKRLTP